MLLIGLDGADWRVMKPLMEKGQLPTLARLAAEGVRGDLLSFEPLASPLVWTSIATGKVPEKHGIKDFFATQSAIKAKRIWDIVRQQRPEAKIGLYKYLFTWPPERGLAFVVPGWTARSPETVPAHLRFIKEIEMAGLPSTNTALMHYLDVGLRGLIHGMRVSTLTRCALVALYQRLLKPSNVELHYRKQLLEALIAGDIYSRLMRKQRLDFSASIYAGLDGISHHYWKYYEPHLFRDVSPREKRRYGDVVARCYRAADRMVGRLMQSVGRETNVIVASDHGFRASKDCWMKRQLNVGLLLQRLGIDDRVYVSIILDKVHLRLRAGSRAERSELVEMLRGIEYRDSRESFLEVDLGSDDASIGIRPRQIVDQGDNPSIRMLGGEVRLQELLIEKAEISGTHDPTGILIMRGPAVNRGADIGVVSVLDLTPTMLVLMNLAVGRDMDGRVLSETIEPEFLRRHPIRYVDSYEESAHPGPEPAEIEERLVAESIVGERLRGLGYIE
ncbi:hypothetical protein AMJ39_01020 [candidate division TA06 bacterium DG_24]|uniref:Phosphodiesterase n=3 Tax=Bacteria division TA06 TaxID=1156500 RepID=A0A0S8JI62_UNCT6|nr:MAG: hypothetical protein AMJ39_01020 [candidate division TA06 bacterium DG_24]KPK71663.1 MAG: hypothetical protein AMJ82_00145 [candidate division TA06 bacterium SM23_40]KPL09042.1 MAG: hypothetical protein AMJ71_07480 [candidate division TA06 bacterium SM1_40]